jgi:glutathione S-transferase
LSVLLKLTKSRLDQSRSQRILWLLEELNVPYELEIFHRDPVTHLAPPELKKVHGLGKSPVLSVTAPRSDEVVVIAESGNIVEYVLDHWGKESTLLPKRYKEGQEGKVGGETEEWLRFRYYMHYAEGSLMILMVLKIVVNSKNSLPLNDRLTDDLYLDIKNAPVPFFLKPITNGVAGKINSGFLDPNFKTHFEFLESQISTSSGQYLCGKHLTGADILMSFPLIAGKGRAGMSEITHPNLWAYTTRLEKEPGYQKAVQKIIEIDGKFKASI